MDLSALKRRLPQLLQILKLNYSFNSFTSMPSGDKNFKQEAPFPLLLRLNRIEGLGLGKRRLVVVMGLLGDFDSFEFAQVLVPCLEQLERNEIEFQVFGIGEEEGAKSFCRFTGFPSERLHVEETSELHQELGLYSGPNLLGGPWPSFLLMCAGVGSPGTLKEVFRGYIGDRSAKKLFADGMEINLPLLPGFKGALFNIVGGNDFLRPLELATRRLQNMIEVLKHWEIYVPSIKYLSQRGATFFISENNELLYQYRSRNILGYSASMNSPLSFLETYLVK